MDLAYERVTRKLLKNQPKPKPFCMFIDGKFLTGTQSLHRTPAARMWRTFLRMKTRTNRSIA